MNKPKNKKCLDCNRKILKVSKRCVWCSKKGKLNTFYGRHHSETVKKKMSDGKKGQHYSPLTEFRKGGEAWNKGGKNPKIWGEKNYNWKGGHVLKQTGYRLRSEKGRRILEHRLVVEQHLKRMLESYEIVHHLNGIRHDNRIENLVVTNSKDHEKRTLVVLQAKRIRELETKLKKLL